MYSQSLLVIDLQLPEKTPFPFKEYKSIGEDGENPKQNTETNEQNHKKNLLMMTTRVEHEHFFPNHLQLILKSITDTLVLPYGKLTP